MCSPAAATGNWQVRLRWKCESKGNATGDFQWTVFVSLFQPTCVPEVFKFDWAALSDFGFKVSKKC